MRLTEEQEMQAGHNGQGNDFYIFPKILPITFLPYWFKQWRAIVWCKNWEGLPFPFFTL